MKRPVRDADPVIFGQRPFRVESGRSVIDVKRNTFPAPRSHRYHVWNLDSHVRGRLRGVETPFRIGQSHMRRMKPTILIAISLCLVGCGQRKDPSDEQVLFAEAQLARSTCHDEFGFTEDLRPPSTSRSRAWLKQMLQPIAELHMDLATAEDREESPHHLRNPLEPPLDTPDEYRKTKADWIAKAKQPYEKALAACQLLFVGNADPLKLEKIQTRLSYEFDQNHP